MCQCHWVKVKVTQEKCERDVLNDLWIIRKSSFTAVLMLYFSGPGMLVLRWLHSFVEVSVYSWVVTCSGGSTTVQVRLLYVRPPARQGSVSYIWLC